MSIKLTNYKSSQQSSGAITGFTREGLINAGIDLDGFRIQRKQEQEQEKWNELEKDKQKSIRESELAKKKQKDLGMNILSFLQNLPKNAAKTVDGLGKASRNYGADKKQVFNKAEGPWEKKTDAVIGSVLDDAGSLFLNAYNHSKEVSGKKDLAREYTNKIAEADKIRAEAWTIQDKDKRKELLTQADSLVKPYEEDIKYQYTKEEMAKTAGLVALDVIPFIPMGQISKLNKVVPLGLGDDLLKNAPKWTQAVKTGLKYAVGVDEVGMVTRTGQQKGFQAMFNTSLVRGSLSGSTQGMVDSLSVFDMEDVSSQEKAKLIAQNVALNAVVGTIFDVGLGSIGAVGGRTQKVLNEKEVKKYISNFKKNNPSSLDVGNLAFDASSIEKATEARFIVNEFAKMEGREVLGETVGLSKEAPEIYNYAKQSFLDPVIEKSQRGEQVSLVEIQSSVQKMKEFLATEDIQTMSVVVADRLDMAKLDELKLKILNKEPIIQKDIRIHGGVPIETNRNGVDLKFDDLEGKRVRYTTADGVEVKGSVQGDILKLDSGRDIELTLELKDRIINNFDIEGVNTEAKFQVEADLEERVSNAINNSDLDIDGYDNKYKASVENLKDNDIGPDINYKQRSELSKRIKEDLDKTDISPFEKLDLNDKEKDIATDLTKAWEVNKIAPHGYRSNSNYRTILFDVKTKYVSEALDKLNKLDTNKIKTWESNNIRYFEVDGRQVSFHMSYQYGESIKDSKAKDWVGAKSRVNPLTIDGNTYQGLKTWESDIRKVSKEIWREDFAKADITDLNSKVSNFFDREDIFIGEAVPVQKIINKVKDIKKKYPNFDLQDKDESIFRLVRYGDLFKKEGGDNKYKNSKLDKLSNYIKDSDNLEHEVRTYLENPKEFDYNDLKSRTITDLETKLEQAKSSEAINLNNADQFKTKTSKKRLEFLKTAEAEKAQAIQYQNKIDNIDSFIVDFKDFIEKDVTNGKIGETIQGQKELDNFIKSEMPKFQVEDTVDPRNFKSAEEYVKSKGEVVYHGTPEKFNIFDKSNVGKSVGSDKEGIFFTNSKTLADRYTYNPIEDKKGGIIEANVNFKKPLEIETEQTPLSYFTSNKEDILKNAKKGGYDGIKIYDEAGDENIIIAFDSSQIKTKQQLIDEWDTANKKFQSSQIESPNRSFHSEDEGFMREFREYSITNKGGEDIKMEAIASELVEKYDMPIESKDIKGIGDAFARILEKKDSQRKEFAQTVYKYFDKDEVDVKFVQSISTPQGQKALGVYFDKMIAFADNANKTTPEHEVLHAYFDMFTGVKRKSDVLAQVKEVQGLKGDVEAEEWLADAFVDFVREGEKSKSLPEQVVEMFTDVWENVKKLVGKEDKVRALYKDVISKNRAEADISRANAMFQVQDADTDILVKQMLGVPEGKTKSVYDNPRVKELDTDIKSGAEELQMVGKKVEKTKKEISQIESQIEEHPAKRLEKYTTKDGRLSDNANSTWSRRGEDVSKALGFKNKQEAMKSFEEYSSLKQKRIDLEDDIDIDQLTLETVTGKYQKLIQEKEGIIQSGDVGDDIEYMRPEMVSDDVANQAMIEAGDFEQLPNKKAVTPTKYTTKFQDMAEKVKQEGYVAPDGVNRETASSKKMREQVKKDFGVDIDQNKTTSKKNIDQVDRALKFVAEDRDRSIRVAMGEEEAPEGLLNSAVYGALRTMSKENRDFELAKKLSQSSIGEKAGQEIQFYSTLNQYDPVAKIEEIMKAKEVRVKMTTGKAPKKAVKEGVEQARRIEVRIDKSMMSSVLDRITC